MGKRLEVDKVLAGVSELPMAREVWVGWQEENESLYKALALKTESLTPTGFLDKTPRSNVLESCMDNN